MNELKLRFVDGDTWEVLEDFPYEGERWTGVVPAGFQTDLASVPRGLWNLFPKAGPYAPAAVVHDYLYETKPVSKADADWTFWEYMERLGIPWLQRTTMYLAVRLFGDYD